MLSRIPAICLAISLCALPVSAETKKPAPFPEFSAKRIKVPSSSSSRRITVQIAPNTNWRRVPGSDDAPFPQPAAAPAKLPKPDAPSNAHYDWFWNLVSPGLDGQGPARLELALQKLSNPPAGKQVFAPRMQSLHNIASAQGIEILKATIGTRVSPALALAVISVESGGRVDAVSSAGAEGLMQLMPATADRFGVRNSFAPADNIRGGVAYLDFLMSKFDGDPILALAGYNAGENAVTRHGGVPPYKETRDYVPKVLAAFQVARGLCVTPPELASDGCVFTVAARN